VEIIALILLPVAIAMCGYAIFVFVWRSQMISRKRVSSGRLLPLYLPAASASMLSLDLHVPLCMRMLQLDMCLQLEQRCGQGQASDCMHVHLLAQKQDSPAVC
jgi:hypothetical protein